MYNVLNLSNFLKSFEKFDRIHEVLKKNTAQFSQDIHFIVLRIDIFYLNWWKKQDFKTLNISSSKLNLENGWQYNYDIYRHLKWKIN